VTAAAVDWISLSACAMTACCSSNLRGGIRDIDAGRHEIGLCLIGLRAVGSIVDQRDDLALRTCWLSGRTAQ